jgi:Endoribonuclease L-PSP
MSEERAVLANDLSLFPAHQAAHVEQSETLDETRGHPGRDSVHLLESADRPPPSPGTAARSTSGGSRPSIPTPERSLENVLKCNVSCTSVEKFAAVNAIYARYFPKDPPARIFVAVPAWPGPLDVEIDCIAAS